MARTKKTKKNSNRKSKKQNVKKKQSSTKFELRKDLLQRNKKPANEVTINSQTTSPTPEPEFKTRGKQDDVSLWKDKINYICDWKNCLKSFKIMGDYFKHVALHISHFEIVDEKYICLWGPCIFTSPCSQEICRHLHYHAYLKYLMTLGKYDCIQANIPKCRNSPENRNLLPIFENDFFCRWNNCSKTFRSITDFHHHVACHCSFDYDINKTPENTSPQAKCLWELCGKLFANKYRLLEHVRSHSNEKSTACDVCGAMFRSRTNLHDHCRRQPSNNTNEFQCGKCFKYFSSLKILRSHASVHINGFKCSLCDMTCNSATGLATHIRYRHIKDRPVKCSKCDYKCVTKKDLKTHEGHIHNKKLYQCAEIGCSYTVKSLSLFRKHYSVVHINNPTFYMCHCCNKVYKRGQDLSRHLITCHKFQLPSGHRRFTYRIDELGFNNLETTRIESLEVTEQILSPNPFLPPSSGCYEILSTHNSTNGEVIIERATIDFDYDKEVIKLDDGSSMKELTLTALDQNGNL